MFMNKKYFENTRFNGIFLTLILILIAYRFISLAETSLWLDEMMQVQIAQTPTIKDILTYLPKDKPPIEYLLLMFISKIGKSDYLLRLPACIFGILILIPIFYFLRKYFNKNHLYLFFIFSVLLLSHPLHFFMSQQLLPYSDTTLWLTVFMVSAIGWVETRLKSLLFLTIISTIFAFMTVYVSIFSIAAIIIGLILGMILNVKNKSKFIKAYLAGFSIWSLVMTILMIFFYWRMHTKFKEPPPPWSFQNLSGLIIILKESFIGKFNNIYLSYIAVSLELILFLFGLFKISKEKEIYKYVILSWLFLGLALFLFAFLKSNHWLSVRYFLPFIIPYTLIQAIGLFSIYELINRKNIRVGQIFLVCILLYIMIYRYEPLRNLRTTLIPNFRQEVEKMVYSDQASICLIDHDYTKYCYNYYKIMRYSSIPEGLVFDPNSSEQMKNISALKSIYIFPITADGFILNENFSKILKNYTGKKISPQEIIQYYNINKINKDFDKSPLK